MSSQNNWKMFIEYFTKNQRKMFSNMGLTTSKECTLKNSDRITLRLERKKDYQEVELLT